MSSQVPVFPWPLEALDSPGEYPGLGLEVSGGAALRLEVYAVNAKGRSPPATLTGLRLGDAEKQAGW